MASQFQLIRGGESHVLPFTKHLLWTRCWTRCFLSTNLLSYPYIIRWLLLLASHQEEVAHHGVKRPDLDCRAAEWFWTLVWQKCPSPFPPRNLCQGAAYSDLKLLRFVNCCFKLSVSKCLGNKDRVEEGEREEEVWCREDPSQQSCTPLCLVLFPWLYHTGLLVTDSHRPY